MTNTPDPEQIAGLLHSTGIADGVIADDISVLSTKGISHDHWRIGETGLVLRIPRMNQWGMEPQEALNYQKTAFQRAAASGHAPDCVETLPPTLALPRGALIVEEIIGRAPRLPDELGAIADTLAALHGMPMPAEQTFAPLQIHRNPVSSTLQVIEEQAIYLARAQLDRQSDSDIRTELEWARDFASNGEPRFSLCFVGTDTHPGNFLVDDNGKSWFVDLEKSVYGAAPIDLAHATLATSTGWDPDCSAQLSPEDVAKFYRRYLRSVGPDRADELEPWLLPLRRLTWLRTITWFARWRAQWSKENHAAARDATMTEHVRAHIERSFRPDSISAIRQEWLVPHALGF
ncbi:MAG: aminoglycoside phosphotransferase family protein [Alphaproteobacteria bacterium]